MWKEYLVCPRCLSVEEVREASWYETFRELNRYRYAEDERGFPASRLDRVLDSEHVLTEHSCGFESEEWRAEDFKVVVEDGKIVEVDVYWESDMETLEEALRRGGILKEGGR